MVSTSPPRRQGFRVSRYNKFDVLDFHVKVRGLGWHGQWPLRLWPFTPGDAPRITVAIQGRESQYSELQMELLVTREGKDIESPGSDVRMDNIRLPISPPRTVNVRNHPSVVFAMEPIGVSGEYELTLVLKEERPGRFPGEIGRGLAATIVAEKDITLVMWFMSILGAIGGLGWIAFIGTHLWKWFTAGG